MCCLHYQVLHPKQPWRKLVSGFSFACNKYPLQFTMTRAMTAQWRKESHWMCFIIFLLIWKGIQTSHSKISRPWRVKSLGFVCSPSFFSLPAACCLFLRGVIFTSARISLALLSLRKNGGLLVVYPVNMAFNTKCDMAFQEWLPSHRVLLKGPSEKSQVTIINYFLLYCTGSWFLLHLNALMLFL